MASASGSPSSSAPVAIVCIGMAGSGKTTFMQRINSHLHTSSSVPYVINLDPAVRNVPFEPNIDIRDSVNYKEVMKQFNLGPNGGILTSLNLFSTKIDQVLGLLEKRTQPPPAPSSPTTEEFMTGKGKGNEISAPHQKKIKHILVDTPGQIEVFVWSASGEILLSSLASTFPTVIAYIIDTPRTTSTSTFMSNMLYACSILYKTKLPMILVFNKTDAQDASFAKEWMTDFGVFQTALRKEEHEGSFEGEGSALGGGSGYMGSLLNSMSLVLEEFYKHLSVVGVSAMTGDGIDDFFEGVQEKKEEFIRDYQPELERRRQKREKEKVEKREKDLDRLMRDMNVSSVGSSQKAKVKARKGGEPETVSDAEDMNDDEQERMILDEVDEDDEDDDPDASLEKRYKQAINNSKEDSGNPSGDDFSFVRYMHKANIG